MNNVDRALKIATATILDMYDERVRGFECDVLDEEGERDAYDLLTKFCNAEGVTEEDCKVYIQKRIERNEI